MLPTLLSIKERATSQDPVITNTTDVDYPVTTITTTVDYQVKMEENTNIQHSAQSDITVPKTTTTERVKWYHRIYYKKTNID